MHDCAMEYKECKNYGNYENNAIYNKNASSKSMFWMQIIANIVPIFANIALAIMACLQKKLDDVSYGRPKHNDVYCLLNTTNYSIQCE